MVSQEELKELKQIYLKEYGVKLNDQEALTLDNRLLELFKAIYQPIPNDSPFLKRRDYAKSKNRGEIKG
jgi:hypothetical protein